MKYILLLFQLLFVATMTMYGQQIDVRATGPSSQNSLNTYNLENATVQYVDSTLLIEGTTPNSQTLQPITLGISPGFQLLNTIDFDGELKSILIDGSAKRLQEVELQYFDSGDNTIDIHQFDDGRFIMRDNIANFTLFDVEGSVDYSVSNSSQSLDGESVSEIAFDRFGRTLLLYNPRIVYGDQIGSRARIVKGENDFIDIYNSDERYIKFANVSKSGSYFWLNTGKDEENDIVLLFDRFGNQLGEIISEEDVTGVDITREAEFITLYSTGRVQVFSVIDSERVGSTSIQAPVIYAEYQPDDNQIIILTGELESNQNLMSPRIYSVHLGERQLARVDVDSPLSTLDIEKIDIERLEANLYRISGLNRQLEVRTEF